MNKEGNNNRSGSRPSSSRPYPTNVKKGHGPKKLNNTPAKQIKFKKQITKKTQGKDEIRLNKYISIQGFSRRDADIYIQSGTVKVNGVAVTEMGYMVKPGDVVNFDGATLTPEEFIILLNKPKNFTWTKGRNFVMFY
jgi:23S rRNA pseudouridine2605 synthase